MTYRVRYWIATYSGERFVEAEDEDHAIAKVRAWVRKQRPPIGYEHYEAAEAL